MAILLSLLCAGPPQILEHFSELGVIGEIRKCKHAPLQTRTGHWTGGEGADSKQLFGVNSSLSCSSKEHLVSEEY